MPPFISRRVLGLAALLATVAGAASAGPTFPARKPGLWEMSATEKEGGRPAITVQQCVDAATDKALQEYGLNQPKMNRKACKEEMRNEAGKMLVHTEVCKRSDTTMTRRIVISGDFNAAYRVESHTSYDPMPRTPPHDGDMVAEMRWQGACTAGMKPGDMMMPGGMKMNIADMMALGAAASGQAASPMVPPEGGKIDLEAMKRMAAEMQKRTPAGAAAK